MFKGFGWAQCFPIIGWLRHYKRKDWQGDSLAGIITAIMLVPQGIAYAILAGLPPEMGLYASMLPALVYTIWGSSRTMSVGPVSIAAIMVASALHAPEIAVLNTPVTSALVLAAETGLILLLMAALNFGGLVNFISHPVITGFTSAAAILIIFNQLPNLIGLPALSCGATEWDCYPDYLSQIDGSSFLIGFFAIGTLWLFNKPLTTYLTGLGWRQAWVVGVSRCGPLLIVAITALLVVLGALPNAAVVGDLGATLPTISIAFIGEGAWQLLLPYALFIALIAYVESVAIAKVTAHMRNQKINPNQELAALGMANIATAATGGMVVAGGLSRTMVNFSAGARTQISMIVAVVVLILAVIFIGTWFSYIPKAVLAAIIFIAILPLIKLRHVFQTWCYHRADGWAELLTLVGVLVLGIELGLLLGIVLTIGSNLRQISRPHIAEVGRVPQTAFYRNIKRHNVTTWDNLILLRIDENITFANAGYIEDYIQASRNQKTQVTELVLIFASVSHVDSTALSMLKRLKNNLALTGVILYFAEVKGPVMDQLERTSLLHSSPPTTVFFHTSDAVAKLT